MFVISIRTIAAACVILALAACHAKSGRPADPSAEAAAPAATTAAQPAAAPPSKEAESRAQRAVAFDLPLGWSHVDRWVDEGKLEFTGDGVTVRAREVLHDDSEQYGPINVNIHDQKIEIIQVMSAAAPDHDLRVEATMAMGDSPKAQQEAQEKTMKAIILMKSICISRK